MTLGAFKRVLAIGAHPDDTELGCAGTIALAIRAGARVEVCVMSRCTDEARRGKENVRVDEFSEAAKRLGVHKTHVYDFRNRDLPSQSLDMMNRFAELQTSVKPDIVLIPWTEDSHQDHSAVAFAAVRSFRARETVLEYEILRYGSRSFTPKLFVDISEVLDLKIDVLSCFRSQMERRAYFDEESFRGLARTRGSQIGYDYAEGFLVHKMLW